MRTGSKHDKDYQVILGLGMTGLSCVRHCLREGQDFVVMDTRMHPPGLEQLKEIAPDATVSLGEPDQTLLNRATAIIVSPGLDTAIPELESARECGVPLIGDIEIFARVVARPVIAITGSNGKSTVTDLVGRLVAASGAKVLVGGNIGVPALDLLEQPEPEFYVLELSSYQLETTDSLQPVVATILNLSDDHLDRYGTMPRYGAAKQRIYRNAEHCIMNLDDPATRPQTATAAGHSGFTRDAARHRLSINDFGILDDVEQSWLVRGRKDKAVAPERLLATDRLRLAGRHNQVNACAALALVNACGIALDTAVLDALCDYPGLPHRCQWVGEHDGVRYINDSKATNPGAALAALESFATGSGRIILIAGGDAKGADLSVLGNALGGLRKLITLGRDGDKIAALAAATPVEKAADMRQAVEVAAKTAQSGDLVLLSPACASLDMYRNYAERGQHFIDAVGALA